MSTSLILVFLAALVTVMVLVMRRYRQKTEGTPEEVERCVAGGSCCGGVNCHRKHGKDKLRGQITYFEDEELDRYKGKKATDYTPDEIAEWEEVVTTLRASEVTEWVTSIHRRQLHIPSVLQPIVTERLRGEQLIP